MYLLAIIASVFPLYVLMRAVEFIQEGKTQAVKVVASLACIAAAVSLVALFVGAGRLDRTIAGLMPGAAGAGGAAATDPYSRGGEFDTTIVSGVDTVAAPYVIPATGDTP